MQYSCKKKKKLIISKSKKAKLTTQKQIKQKCKLKFEDYISKNYKFFYNSAKLKNRLRDIQIYNYIYIFIQVSFCYLKNCR